MSPQHPVKRTNRRQKPRRHRKPPYKPVPRHIPEQKSKTRRNLNIFIATQMRTGSTWLCDIVSSIFNKRWQFWARGRDIGKDRFQNRVNTIAGINIYKMHYTPVQRICECIPEDDKNNYVLSITRNLADVAVSKILYMRYDSGVRNLTRMQDVNKVRLDFDREQLKDKEYINEFIKTNHFKHIVRNWKMYNDGYSHPNYLLINYEELSARPALQLMKIYEFLGIKVPLRQGVRQIVVRNNFKQKTGRNKGQERNSAFRRKGIVGDSKNYLNEESLEIIKNLLDKYDKSNQEQAS